MCDPPPEMRGLFMKRARRTVLEAVACGLLASFLFQQFYVKPRHKRMADYYLDFDPEVSLEYMCKQGYMQSAPQGDK